MPITLSSFIISLRWSVQKWSSHLYRLICIGFGGSTGYISIFSFPIPLSLGIAPQNITIPFSGVLLYLFRYSIVVLRASCTWFLVRSDLMFEAVPASLRSWEITSKIGRFGGTYTVTSSVPWPDILDSSFIILVSLYRFTEFHLPSLLLLSLPIA